MIQVQGNNIELFTSYHFPILKDLVQTFTDEVVKNTIRLTFVENKKHDLQEETLLKTVNPSPSQPNMLLQEMDQSSITQAEDEHEVQPNSNLHQPLASEGREPLDKESLLHTRHTEDRDTRRLQEKLENQEKMTLQIITTLNSMEGKCCQISELKDNVDQLVAEKNVMKAHNSEIEKRVLFLEDRAILGDKTASLEKDFKEMAIQLGILQKTISGQSESDHQSEMSLLRRKINELRHEKETVELEMKNLLDSLKTLEKKIENKDSIIHTLTKDNEELTQDNTRLKDKLRKFREEETSFTLDTSTLEKNENVQCNIQTNNSFAALQDMETAMFRQEDDLNNTDITIIADSHGREIDPKKIYRNKKVEIKVLDARKKNLDGAIEYIQSSQNIGKETVILVGNNDLQHSSVDTVFQKFHDLGVNFKKKFPSNHLSIVPILPRYENDNYNSDASTINMRLQEYRLTILV